MINPTKRRLTGGVAVILILILAWLYYVEPVPTTVTPDQSVEVVNTQLLEVIPLATEVTLLRSTTTVLSEPTKVVESDTLTTSPTGRAVIVDETKTIRTSLDANTSLRISSAPLVTGSRFTLVAGRLWAQVMRTLELDEVYEVYTPTLVAAVRGTSFGVDIRTIPQILVTDGEVAVYQRDGETGEPRLDTLVLATAGTVVFEAEGTLQTRPFSTADYDEWYLTFNESPVADVPPAIPIIDASPQSPAPAPAPRPIVPNPVVNETESTTTPPVATTVILSISSIEPEVVIDQSLRTIRVYGKGFTTIEGLYLNRRPTEFTVMRDDFLYIETTELSGNDTYDLRLVSVSDELVLEDAIVVAYEEEAGPQLVINDVVIGYDASQSQYVRLSGTGFTAATAVSINGQTVSEFTVASDNEIRVYDQVTTPTSATVSTSAGTATWPQ